MVRSVHCNVAMRTFYLREDKNISRRVRTVAVLLLKRKQGFYLSSYLAYPSRIRVGEVIGRPPGWGLFLLSIHLLWLYPRVLTFLQCVVQGVEMQKNDGDGPWSILWSFTSSIVFPGFSTDRLRSCIMDSPHDDSQSS